MVGLHYYINNAKFISAVSYGLYVDDGDTIINDDLFVFVDTDIFEPDINRVIHQLTGLKEFYLTNSDSPTAYRHVWNETEQMYKAVVRKK